jgi:SAM-dependent methyltransferase
MSPDSRTCRTSAGFSGHISAPHRLPGEAGRQSEKPSEPHSKRSDLLSKMNVVAPGAPLPHHSPKKYYHMIAQQESIAFSGNIPANYDNYLGPLFFEPFALEVAARIRPLQPAALLEIACGTGRVTRHLPSNLPAGADIVATDINPEMLAYAQKMMPEGNSIIWDIADAVSLPYRNESFDCILSQFGVMFYSDRPQAYAEALRTLKPGGTFVFTVWDTLRFNPPHGWPTAPWRIFSLSTRRLFSKYPSPVTKTT